MSQSDQGGAGRREVAYRVFASEYDDADFSYSESDEERAPNYVITPTGARINRLFVVGVLTEIEQVNDDVLRARIVDPTGAFVVYAGQYQPDEMAFLDRAEPPMFVSVTGKARTFQPDDADTVYTSIRPESINEVDAETRDRWTVSTVDRTLDRITTMATALGRDQRGDALRDVLVESGVDEGLAAGTALAIDHYGTTPTYLDALRETALDAARVVAGERDEVRSRSVAPDASGETPLSALTGLDVSQTPSDVEPTTEETTATAPADQSPTESESVSSESTTDTAATEQTPTTESSGSTEPVSETQSTDTETGGVDSTDTEPSAVDSTETTTTTDTETTADTPDVDSTETTTVETDTVETGTGDSESTDEDIGDFEPGEFELEDETREEIEDEYGTEFATGTEVDEPGEADIETPDPEDAEAVDSTPTTEPASTSDAAVESDSATESEPEPDSESTSASEPTEEDDETPEEDIPLSSAVMNVMRDLNGGDGADREELVATVVDQHGATPDEVEDAIQDALMDGRCYEPDDTTLKPI